MKKVSVVLLSLLLIFSQLRFFALADDLPPIDTLAPPSEEVVPEPIPEPASDPTSDPIVDPTPVDPFQEPPIVTIPDPAPEPTPEPLPTPEPTPEPTHVAEPLPVLPPDPNDFIFINEILADPDGDDTKGEFIELYNAGSQSVDLSGYRLDDSNATDGSYKFLNKNLNYVLNSDSYLVLYRPETKIVLNNDKDTVTLFDPAGKEIDSFAYGQQTSGHSVGRNPEKLEEWMTFKTPTPGSLNALEPNGLPVAAITVQQDTRYMKLNVTGDSSSDPDGDLLSFLWEFEDGIFDTRSNPLIYEYKTPGTKLVSLTVTDTRGASNKAEITFIAAPGSTTTSPITSPTPETLPVSAPLDPIDTNHPPVSVITIQLDTRHMKLNVTGENSSDPDGDKLTYLWEFEDGVVDTRSNPLIYEYKTSGSKTVTLTVIDSHGASGKSEITFVAAPDGVITPPASPTPSTLSLDADGNPVDNNHSPVAIITIQKDSRYMKLNLTGESSSDPDGDKLTYLWDVGDGVSDTRSNPLIHEYQTPGNKHAHLTVTDSHGASSQTEVSFSAAPKGSTTTQISPETFPDYSLINEILPAPAGKDDEHEWVELYNENSFGIDLSGWYLDDAEGKSSPYKIPEGIFILPDSYLLFSAPDLQLSFNNSADTVRLLDPYKNVNQQVDYADPKENWSFARNESGSFEWTPLLTPGEANEFITAPKSYQAGDVVFESVLPNPKGSDKGHEKITLKNKTDNDISLMGWTMADATGSEKPLPDLFLAAGKTVTLLASDVKLSLNNSDEQLTLFDPFGNLIDEIKWKTSSSGEWLFNTDSLQDGMTAQVVRVIDGDTFVIRYNDKNLTVRMLGIDTPETVHPFKPIEYFGKQASQFLSQTLSNQSVTLEFDQNKIDKYGRVLAYVYLKDQMVNREILKQGYGYAYTRFPFKYLDEFVGLEKEARSAKIGLWQNQKVKDIIDQLIKDGLNAEEELQPDELVPLVEDKLVTDIPEEVPIPETPTETLPDCASDFLRIDSFLPNPQKGSSERITLINIGSKSICLTGWKLDDKLDGGSKPFLLKGGSIAPGGIRNFRKQETKLSLNNSNDCVSLINPGGSLADQICYEKTHKNEIFTHLGGDWKPKPKVKKSSSGKKSKTQKFSFQRDFVSYQSELPTATYIGTISLVDEKTKLLTMALETKQTVAISYASSPVNLSAAREMIDFSQPVKVKVYESPISKNLISIEPVSTNEKTTQQDGGNHWFEIILFLTLPLLLAPLVLKRLRQTDKL